MTNFTPREIVSELDRYIVGQKGAKRAVAVALRNRWRRQQVPAELRDEIAPKNIIMIGPTGVGKTEIARRLAKLAQAPFIKVEASKFTEVGYVGRDVESMVRDLLDLAIIMVKEEEAQKVRIKAEDLAEERLLDLLLPGESTAEGEPGQEMTEHRESTREKLRKLLRKGALNDRTVEVESQSNKMPMMEIFTPQGTEEMGINMKEMFGNLFPQKTKRRRMKVAEARELLIQSEAEKLVDMEKVNALARERTEQSGIIFIDEIDKIASREGGQGPEVSREGVQRDILPIVEGSTVNTKYGPVKTDHMLFIAAGAFHVAKPSDLIPELQGRFPIRVELENLGEEEFVRILTEPKNALIRQYAALMKTESLELVFHRDAVQEIARTATVVNERTENIGARRLHTIMEKLLEDLSFEAPERRDAEILRQRIGAFGPHRVIFVDGRVGRGIFGAERQAQRRLRRGPDDAADAGAQGGVEDVVGRDDVGAEGDFLGHQVGRRDRRQMHDGIGRAELAERVVLAAGPLHCIHHLAEIGQVDLQRRADRIRGRLYVDVQHFEAALDQMTADRPPCLAAAAGDDDVFHGSSRLSLAGNAADPVAQGSRVGIPPCMYCQLASSGRKRRMRNPDPAMRGWHWSGPGFAHSPETR